MDNDEYKMDLLSPFEIANIDDLYFLFLKYN